MALFDSADLLARFRTATRMPSGVDFPATADIYSYLGQGQIDVMTRLALFAPLSNRITPTQMTQRASRTVVSGTTSGSAVVTSSALYLLSDIGAGISGSGIPTGSTILSVNTTSSIIISQNATATASPTLTVNPDPNYPYTWTFGQDADGNALYPLGEVQLFRTVNDIPDWPMIEGVEYLMEGNIIRAPSNGPLSGTTAPYFQCLVLPLTLSATQSPVLKPMQARELILHAACVLYSGDVGDSGKDTYQDRFDKAWDRWIGAIQAQYQAAGRIAASHATLGPARWKWYRGFPFGGMR